MTLRLAGTHEMALSPSNSCDHSHPRDKHGTLGSLKDLWKLELGTWRGEGAE